MRNTKKPRMNTDEHRFQSVFIRVHLWLLLVFPARGEIVDRIVATAGKEIVTLSDVQREQRIECFQQGRQVAVLDAARLRELATRLVDQALIRREMQNGAFPPAPPEKLDPQMEAMRGRFPDSAAYRAALEHCGLEEETLRRHVQFQMEMMNFIDFRVRPGLQVAPEEIESYYRQEFLPELRKQGSPAPSLEEVREKILAILSERQVNQRLAVWIAELRSHTVIRLR